MMSESNDYLMLNELKTIMGKSWREDYESQASWLLSVASAGLRTIFARSGRNLDAELITGPLELISVKQAIADMVSRNLVGQDTPLGGDFSQFSQSAGGYSISVTSNGGNLYLKREQAKWLGLPDLAVTTINLFGSHHERPQEYL